MGIFLFLLLGSAVSAAENMTSIDFKGKLPEGLVGNGRSVVKVGPAGFRFHTGGDASGEFRLVVNGKLQDFVPFMSDSSFFPGGAEYHYAIWGLKVDVLHGADADDPYFAVIRVTGGSDSVELDIRTSGVPAVGPSGRVFIPMKNGTGQLAVSAGPHAPSGSYEEIKERLSAPYKKGFTLKTPDPLVDRAVLFNRYLLNLGFDGNLHVCELFRWRDVWSRDLGSGLAPGAMAAGEYAAARTTIEYDLRRYAAHTPRGLKVTEDPSQGGGAEGVAWLTRAVWRYYLLTGDRDFLARAERTLLPWVEAWLDRDTAGEGLLVDVTEWMDHSRFFLFTDGARILYSNVLFAGLLDTFSAIERELGSAEAAKKLETARERFVRGINSGLWNETAGRYDNLSLWGKRDERSSSGENALAVLEGVAPAERIPRILRAVKESNWREAGSATIFPPMTHVGLDVDHNFKVWPWWNAVEAKARFLNGDIEGGVHLLRSCSKTLEDPHYPGMMEELLSPDGSRTEGGNAFLTAAGSYQDAVFGGLLGIEILEAGRARIRVSPNTPAAWKDWSASVPLPGGEIALEQKNGKLRILVSDPAVKMVEAPETAKVEGAERVPVSSRARPALSGLTAPESAAVPAPRRRVSAVFYDKNIPAGPLEGLPARRVSVDGLLGLDRTDIDALIIAGNALPARTAAGTDTRPALAGFLDRGGALVFYGAAMDDRGRVGETGGVIDWYELRPSVGYSAVSGWLFRASTEGPGTPREKERGLAEGWFKPSLSEAGWEKIEVPAPWEKHFGRDYDGWGWYRAHFRLPAGARGKTLTFSMGRADDMDWTFVNGVLIGSDKDWIKFRRYTLKPGQPAYASLNFGGDNVLAVQVWDGGGGGGLYADPVELGVDTGRRAWQAVSQTDGMTFAPPVRHGVVSWGPGNFFNSWETSRGAFGFRIEGRGVEFSGPLAGLPPLDIPVREAFTDFAVSRPWRFQPLAFTSTGRNLLVPDNGERYPCAARVLNTETGGEFILIPASAAAAPAGPEMLKKLLLY